MRKHVLFYAQTVYPIPLDKKNSEKFKKLSEFCDVTVFAQTNGRLFRYIRLFSGLYLFPRYYSFLLRHIIFLLSSLIILPLIIKERKIEVVIFQTPLDGHIIAYLRLLFRDRIRIVCEFHGDLIGTKDKYKKNRVRELLSVLLYRVAVRYSDIKRKVSQSISEETEVVFPAFMDIEYFRRPIDVKRENNILFAGVLEKVKRVDLLIEAFAELAKHKLRDYHLIIAGSGSLENELKGLCKKRGIEDKVIFTGNVSRDRLKELYYSSKLFVLPSYNEGFGRVAAEAAVCGCKVLVSENCGIAPFLNRKQIFKDYVDLKKKMFFYGATTEYGVNDIEFISDGDFFSGINYFLS